MRSVSSWSYFETRILQILNVGSILEYIPGKINEFSHWHLKVKKTKIYVWISLFHKKLLCEMKSKCSGIWEQLTQIIKRILKKKFLW